MKLFIFVIAVGLVYASESGSHEEETPNDGPLMCYTCNGTEGSDCDHSPHLMDPKECKHNETSCFAKKKTKANSEVIIIRGCYSPEWGSCWSECYDPRPEPKEDEEEGEGEGMVEAHQEGEDEENPEDRDEVVNQCTNCCDHDRCNKGPVKNSATVNNVGLLTLVANFALMLLARIF